MKTVILCGGKGTRLREETEFKPKPLVRIGERPILWHIMKTYSHSGFHDFVLCLGYKGDLVRQYFINYAWNESDMLLELGSNRLQPLNTRHDEKDWRLWLIDTGTETLTGGRLKRVERHITEETFMATYGDGVADVDIEALLAFHRKQGKLATVTAVRPSSRFGELSIEGNEVKTFAEKPQVHAGWINGGFFVFQREVFSLLGGDQESLETGLLEKLAQKGELAVYMHDGFWQCMDTYREMELLNELWESDQAPWAVWQ